MSTENNNPIVRMEDLAMAAGVSKATVSKALRSDPTISVSTRDRIVALARSVGYKRNALMGLHMAHVRASRHPEYRPVIAFVWLYSMPVAISEMGQGTSRDFWDGARACCDELGYRLEDFYPIRDGMPLDKMARIFRTRDIRGVIVGPKDANIPTDEKAFHPLWSQFAVALTGYSFRSVPMHRASNHHYFSVLDALSHLSRLGYQKVGVAGDCLQDRQVGFQLCGAAHAIHAQLPDNKWIAPFFPQGIDREAFLRWYEDHRPDAILAVDNRIPDWLKGAGIRIPRDVAVASLTTYPGRALAGIDQHSQRVGAAAAHLVIGQFHRNEQGVPTWPKEVLIRGEWVDGPSAPDRNAAQIQRKRRDRKKSCGRRTKATQLDQVQSDPGGAHRKASKK